MVFTIRANWNPLGTLLSLAEAFDHGRANTYFAYALSKKVHVTQDPDRATFPGSQCCVSGGSRSNDWVEHKIAWLVWGVPKGM